MPAHITPITGPAVWTGADLLTNTDWIFEFTPAHLREIDSAIIATRHMTPQSITKNDFDIPATAELLAAVGDELENGRGIARLRRLPIDRYDEKDIERMYWGISLHLGTPVYQNQRGERLNIIRDETRTANNRYKTETGLKSAGAKAFSTDGLNFHTDTTDVIGLLCIRNAASGGLSKIASTAKAHNEVLARRPDLLEVLYADWWHLRPEIMVGRTIPLPLFGMKDGKLTSSFSPANLRKAHEHPNTPELTPRQIEALDFLLKVKEENCLQIGFEPGDAQYLNNHIVSHGRTAFTEGGDPAQSRFMMRVWLATPDSRPLPEGFDALWGDIAPGAIRGGAPQGNGARA